MNKRTKAATSLIAAQIAVILIIGFIAPFFVQDHPVRSVLAGGGIGLFATVFFSLRVLAGRMEWSPQRFLQRFYRAEMQKLALIAVMTFAALVWLDLNALAVILTLAAVLTANWLALLIK